MGNSYRQEKGKTYQVTTRAKKGAPTDRYGDRERARALERRVRSKQSSSSAYDRHAHQIHLAWNASDQRQRRKKRQGQIGAAVLIGLFLVVGFMIVMAMI